MKHLEVIWYHHRNYCHIDQEVPILQEAIYCSSWWASSWIEMEESFKLQNWWSWKTTWWGQLLSQLLPETTTNNQSIKVKEKVTRPSRWQLWKICTPFLGLSLRSFILLDIRPSQSFTGTNNGQLAPFRAWF